MLPPFNFRQPVSAEAGQLDRIQLTIGSWIVSSGSHDVCALKKALAGPPAGVPNGVASGAFGWIFNSPRDHGYELSEQQVRQAHLRGGGADGAPPLFSGLLMVKKDAGLHRLFVDLDQIRLGMLNRSVRGTLGAHLQTPFPGCERSRDHWHSMARLHWTSPTTGFPMFRASEPLTKWKPPANSSWTIF